MKDEIEILLRYSEEQWNYIRHLEDQRATFTNIVTIVAAGIPGFISQKGLSVDSIPLTILLIILGVFGTIVAEKFNERYRLHSSREELWMKAT